MSTDARDQPGLFPPLSPTVWFCGAAMGGYGGYDNLDDSLGVLNLVVPVHMIAGHNFKDSVILDADDTLIRRGILHNHKRWFPHADYSAFARDFGITSDEIDLPALLIHHPDLDTEPHTERP